MQKGALWPAAWEGELGFNAYRLRAGRTSIWDLETTATSPFLLPLKERKNKRRHRITAQELVPSTVSWPSFRSANRGPEKPGDCLS